MSDYTNSGFLRGFSSAISLYEPNLVSAEEYVEKVRTALQAIGMAYVLTTDEEASLIAGFNFARSEKTQDPVIEAFDRILNAE